MNENELPRRTKRRSRLYVIAVFVLLALFLGVAVFWPQRALSPVERKVEAWLRGVSSNGNMNSAGIDDLGPEAISVLIAALTNQNSRAQMWYWKVNRKMPVSVRRLLPRARNAEAERLAVTIHLFESSYTHIAVPALVRLSIQPPDNVRSRAADILSQATTIADADWLPNLTESLHRETDTYRRIRLATAIGRIDPNASEISTILERALNNRDPSLRKLATEGLGEIARQKSRPLSPKQNGKDE